MKQVNALSNGHDFITVSSGGNDVGLVDLLNECIYTWQPSGTFGSGCTSQIATSTSLIQDVLPDNLDQLYAAIKGKLNANGTVYITAYTRFFDETTTDCDSVSWHWYSWPSNVLNWQYLTQFNRHRLNVLCDMVNAAIVAAAERAGSQFVVVDYDVFSPTLNGIYCEPGVQEPSPNRPDLLFYMVTKKSMPRCPVTLSSCFLHPNTWLTSEIFRRTKQRI